MTAAFERKGSPYALYIERINNALDRYFPLKECPQQKVYEAARYSLLAKGKRIRPVLALEFCRMLGGDTGDAMPFACALEMIHAYSLIHDDLPCMDDDDLRRGRPTNHKVYGEAMALLAGDALLTAAFETVLRYPANLSAEQIFSGLRALAVFAGAGGMIGGQALDIGTADEPISIELLTEMHTLKTGALINAACILGAVAANADSDSVNLASEYGRYLGLAFQIVDDILDKNGDSEAMGKQTNKDQALCKNTFVSVLGMDKSLSLAAEYTEKALETVRRFDDCGFLAELTDYLLQRTC